MVSQNRYVISVRATASDSTTNTNRHYQTRAKWITERFNARQENTLADARLSLPAGSHSAAETNALLTTINREKMQCMGLVGAAIDGSWIGYANAMGLKYQERHTPESLHIVTVSDLRQALRDLPEKEQPTALYFITAYTRDVLYSQVLWGITHQTAVEDYAMERLHASFAIPRAEMQAGNKTCVAQLYSQVYNRKRMRLQRAVLQPNTTLALGRHNAPNGNWKCPKHMFFVKTTTHGVDGTAQVASRMVSCQCDHLC